MIYTVQKLATIAGVSVRTLHYYDQVGLLKPCSVKANGYRLYGETELLRLQQILFFKELDFPLLEIKRILSSPHFDMRQALRDQRKMIQLKKNRLDRLITTIDRTIKKINKEITMNDNELYGNFSKEEIEKYTEEARKKWGHTDAFKQSQERVKKMGKDGLNKVLKASGELTMKIAETMKAGLNPKSNEVQRLIALHYDGLRAFYEPTFEIYRGLANAYVIDERFKANYENITKGFAQFMHDAMIAYCETEEDKK